MAKLKGKKSYKVTKGNAKPSASGRQKVQQNKPVYSGAPTFKNDAERQAYEISHYGDPTKRKERIANPKGVPISGSLGNKKSLQEFAGMDTQKWGKQKADAALQGMFKEATRLYAAAPLAKLISKAMGGGIAGGILGRQASKFFAPAIRSVIESTAKHADKSSGGMLTKLQNKVTDFAGALATRGRNMTLDHGEKMGFLPKGAKERYNNPAAQKRFQEAAVMHDIRDKTINKDGKHKATVMDYREKIKAARASGNTKEAKRLLKEQAAYKEKSTRTLLKSSQRRKGDDRYVVQQNTAGSGWTVQKSKGVGFSSKGAANIARVMGAKKRHI
jgi:hypothetical protein